VRIHYTNKRAQVRPAMGGASSDQATALLENVWGAVLGWRGAGFTQLGSVIAWLVLLGLLPAALGQTPRIRATKSGLEVQSGNDFVDVEMTHGDVAHVHLRPDGQDNPRTLVMDPARTSDGESASFRAINEREYELSAQGATVQVTLGQTVRIRFCAATGSCLEEPDIMGDAKAHALQLTRDDEDALYGMRGLALNDDGSHWARRSGATIAAGVQGDGGAPFFFTRRYGVLVDSDGGTFQATGRRVGFSGESRRDLDFYVVFGPPLTTMSAFTRLTGLPQMPPKWTLGFLNSQWGTDQAELEQVVSTYREKQIPLDGFILDFDWKAWGEDHYGEWRWNSTNGPGAKNPDLFPDGASGVLATKLLREGVKLSGILKPRILLTTEGSPGKAMEAAAYAEQHHLWFPDGKPQEDYVTHRMAQDLDFNLAETRSWFWEHLKPAFGAGMVGWWNDEADSSDTALSRDFQFVNMARMLYDGQRSASEQRVWSLNRNYYLGANRYAYAMWSGDISTGFPSMAHQRSRMVAALDLGASHWTMDTGGFHGHPTAENYARWVEFAAWVPICRVHGDLGEKRQPWMYGATAEAAATRAIRTRYTLLPYMYSYEHVDHETGIGLVRPMFWMFPNDPHAVELDNEWMFGDALLVSPVVEQGATQQQVYLPAGNWHDFNTGQPFVGGRAYDVPINAMNWSDVPVFVRDGSIVASHQPEQYVDEHPIAEVTVDIFPDEQKAQFAYYDDDGLTYRYEKGESFEQTISAQRIGQQTNLRVTPVKGSFHPPLRFYVMRVHAKTGSVLVSGKRLASGGAGSGSGLSWSSSTDKFGDVTVLRVPAGSPLDVTLR